VDELIRSKMHEALGVEQPDPTLRARVISSLPTDGAGGQGYQKNSASGEPGELRGGWRLMAAGLAAVLTLGVVGGLVYSRLATSNLPGERSGVATVTGVDFRCRLPVLAGASGGFISFPDGAVTIDRAVSLDFNKGFYGYTYDAQVGKWEPVPRSALSPDGRSYAYLAQTSGVPGQMTSMSLRTHEIVSGKDRILWEGSGSPMGPNTVTWLPGGIYFSAVLLTAGDVQGLAFPSVYVADPNQPGIPRRVGPNPPPQPPTAGQTSFSVPDMFTLVGGGAAWGMGNRIPKEAPSMDKPPAPGTFGPDRILRMDLRDGSVSTWYSVSGADLVALVGLDAQGRPILALYQPPTSKFGPDGPPVARILLLTGAGTTAVIDSGSADFRLGSQPWADSHGIWFGSWNSIWLYTQSGGLRQVATIPSGLFPSPSLPPGYPNKGSSASDARSAMPSYMQGTLVTAAGSCT
jgi:hypothetical protein